MARVTGTRGLVAYRAPTPRDALPAWRLARKTPRSDSPGPHYYARWFRDFADTSLVAATGRDVLGFLIGYRRPDALDTYFVLHTEAGPHHGAPALGTHLLRAAAEREVAKGARFVEAAVPPGNTAGTEACEQLARWYGAHTHREPLFHASWFPGGEHDGILHRIGPLHGSS
ncbi:MULTISPECIES: GNAT family N-acetyltransferase [Streptomyces]|uniref:GNAT family N-acetyltransferase n=1 Tax=Streptomyces TaxID=1883 RepID=UPI0016765127|nr:MULTISPECIES: GNAT family N-acetyltransferase [Streptomyces]MBK3521511.1 GNAT family N-acetyltransferase [Streptomyces sp. MBT70]GGR89909.1 L-2,4-diaminobutyric acid acetyltransferase [Streptomyces eurythermus]